MNIELESLIEASKILTKKRLELANTAPLPVWNIVFHAQNHVDKQIDMILREGQS